jgi:hypothetical protein
MSEETEIIKGGERKISLTLHRGSSGLSLSIKAIPQIEEFFQKLSHGEKEVVAIHGGMWLDPDPTRPLQVYYLDRSCLPTVKGDGSETTYTLEKPGEALFERVQSPRTGESCIHPNISFLRLVGISEPGGLTFAIRGVYSKDEVIKMRDRIADSLRRFYIDYMQPMDLTVMISTQDMRL